MLEIRFRFLRVKIVCQRVDVLFRLEGRGHVVGEAQAVLHVLNFGQGWQGLLVRIVVVGFGKDFGVVDVEGGVFFRVGLGGELMKFLIE